MANIVEQLFKSLAGFSYYGVRETSIPYRRQKDFIASA